MKLIDESAKALDDLVKKGAHHFKMSVNISTLELENKDFCETVENIISVYNFGDCILAFEITERLALTATPFIEKSIEKLRQMGIEIIMDDFGMGHSSMSYLQDNKFSYVKIDGALVKQILSNERSCDIVETVCELSQKLGFEVIAEYVETEQQKNKLLSMGCKIYQGYLYSPAINYEAFLKYMKKNGGFNQNIVVEKPAEEETSATAEKAIIGDGSLNQYAAAEKAAAAVHLANSQAEEERKLIENAKSMDDAGRAAAAITTAQRSDAMSSAEAMSIISKTQTELDEMMKSKSDEDEIRQIIEDQAVIDAAIMEKSRLVRERDSQLGLTDYDKLKKKEKKKEEGQTESDWDDV
jgi:EAL domain-containing protein (putative c-di-GMP-specific phosphodiesterase class I)